MREFSEYIVRRNMRKFYHSHGVGFEQNGRSMDFINMVKTISKSRILKP